MNVLVCCEESQAVCIEFRKLGHMAFSCDIQRCSGGFPEWHIVGDCLPLLNGDCYFLTQSGQLGYIDGPWDLIIAHPPCTYLSKAGSCNLFNHDSSIKDYDRLAKGYQAKDFFMKFFNTTCQRVVIENPVPIKLFNLPEPSQIIQPYYFGDNFSKRTCLWLIGLPLLDFYLDDVDLNLVKSWTKLHSSAKIRSKTFPGIARAFAIQYGTCYEPIQLSFF